jgi:hypothetical protein
MSGLTAGAESFIINAKKWHGDKYDYSLAHYTGVHNPVTIICNEQGLFDQLPSVHASKKAAGCPECGTATAARRHSPSIQFNGHTECFTYTLSYVKPFHKGSHHVKISISR